MRVVLRLALLCFVLTAIFPASFAVGTTAAFDLSGPPVEVRVTRAGKSLPIAQVPNLQPGDRLWIHPDLPDSQSVHYLLVVAFLRGSTNPPPDKWFIRAETWNRDVREEGIVITVPKDAQQALLFLAPETGGDFGTLRSAVQGKPGAFIRASQDLDQASLDRSRLEKYLESVRETSSSDAKLLHDRSLLLARSLGIKLDHTCFERPTEQQITCLTQNSDQLVLGDEHSQSLVASLTSGAASDLIGQVSTSPMAGRGYYYSYVGAVVDVVRLMNSYHTAEYQYIPALALPKHEDLNLKLNNPPSFHKPKSVIVVGLPAIADTQPPPLHPVDPESVSCLQKPPLVLGVEGAPLVFSTNYGHDWVLHVENKSHGIDLPVVADASVGGFVVDTHALQAVKLESELRGTLRGYWGFQPFTGPSFHLANSHSQKWSLVTGNQKALIVGRDDALRLQAEGTACVLSVAVKDGQGKVREAAWSEGKSGQIEVQVPLKDATPGDLTIAVQEAGLAKPDEISLHSYSEAAQLDRFTLNFGDPEGTLEGNRLDEVQSMELDKVHLTPGSLTRADDKDELQLAVPSGEVMKGLHPGKKLMAKVLLKDGRVLELQTAVAPPRPKVKLLSKSLHLPQESVPSAIRLAGADDVPLSGSLTFFLKSEVPSSFPRAEKIEVAAADDSFHTLLSVADGNLTLQDSETVLATLNPLKDFGPSAFGPIRFRPVSPTGVAGDWESLAKLVRIPSLKEVRCPDSPEKSCDLIGDNLFLIDSVSATARFTHAVSVPPGFADTSLAVPRPFGTILYIKLRDDPSEVNPVALPVLPEAD